MATIPVKTPHVASNYTSRLVIEATGQTEAALPGNSFVKTDANGRVAAYSSSNNVAQDSGIGFALEPGHNFTADHASNFIEVLEKDQLIEMNIVGAPTAAQLAPGAKYGISLDASGFPVVDTAKTGFPIVEIVGMANRGVTPWGVIANLNSGVQGDTTPRVLVRILDTVSLV